MLGCSFRGGFFKMSNFINALQSIPKLDGLWGKSRELSKMILKIRSIVNQTKPKLSNFSKIKFFKKKKHVLRWQEPIVVFGSKKKKSSTENSKKLSLFFFLLIWSNCFFCFGTWFERKQSCLFLLSVCFWSIIFRLVTFSQQLEGNLTL